MAKPKETEQEIVNRIMNTQGKMAHHLRTHNSILVGVSGGSDSDCIVHMIATYFREYLPKIHFVFFDTGMEYDASKRHIRALEQKYNITIETYKGTPVPLAIKKKGMPIYSKEYSLCMKYAKQGSEWALKRMVRTKQESKYAFPAKLLPLSKEIVQSDVLYSDSCCTLAKKNTLHNCIKEYKADLSITGERRAEGGQRATRHKDCFHSAIKKNDIDKYMPMFFWSDDCKQYYKEHEGIRYSDCYEVWGMKRTGCCGCPFNSKLYEDLPMIKKYEPKKYNMCMHLFGDVYRLYDKYGILKQKIFDESEGE